MRPKNNNNKGLPAHLYQDPRGFFRLRLINGKRMSIGYHRAKAIKIAIAYNDRMRPESGLAELIDASLVGKRRPKGFWTYIDNFKNDTIKERKNAGKPYAQSTLSTFEADCERAKMFFTMLPNEIDLKTVTSYLETNHLNASANVYNKKLIFLKELFSWAVDRGICHTNYAVKKKSRLLGKKVRQRLTIEQYKKIHAAAPLWLQTAMDLSLQTTHARLEVSRIKYNLRRSSRTTNGCVWFKEPIVENGHTLYGQLYINREKTKHNDEAHVIIPIGQALKDIIDRSKKDRIVCPYVVHRRPIKVCNEVSRDCDNPFQVTPEYISKSFSRVRDECGACDNLKPQERPTFHEIRALASHLIKQSGNDPQQRMGHKDARSTDTYTSKHGAFVKVKHVEIAI